MAPRRVVFINPHPPNRRGEESISTIVQMPLNLAYLAALTPVSWERELIDETVESALDERGEVAFGGADLVAITSLTYQTPRSYEIARACRRRGIKVVMGGMHASAVPAEAAAFADAVCVGDGELVWPQMLADFERGSLRPFYQGGHPPLSLLDRVHPDREWCRRRYGYRFSSIVTTKGCPFRCEFCSVPVFQGRKFRERPVEHVIREMEATSYRGLMFAEDNFYGYGRRSHERARRLFRTMVERGIWKDWFGFSTLATAEDSQLLEDMRQSGCFGMLVGLESTGEEALRLMVKDVNLRLGPARIAANVRRMHDAGLIVWGSVIFGADGDGADSFRRVADYVLEHSIDVLTFGISTPLPGTALHKRLLASGRIFRTRYPEDWRYYGTDSLTFKLRDMTLDQFVDGMHYLYRQLYTREAMGARFKRSLEATANARTAMFAHRVTRQWQGVFEQVLEGLELLYDSGAYPAERIGASAGAGAA